LHLSAISTLQARANFSDQFLPYILAYKSTNLERIFGSFSNSDFPICNYDFWAQRNYISHSETGNYKIPSPKERSTRRSGGSWYVQRGDRL